ncbi:hypothetical protein BC351_07780 [Paenibacillus ferrarius]|uniref:Uncharacterized protein n=1 Tax=Paenibacillus ferrarius TaxID=1469647 RepID=A0A1V4HD67_9BACL|nr:DUF3891 family protein [Paenibacillus ferrarius]OPH50544.1 hypothetical protein BC351_07780 [Paenibacillus ferrarius]
MIVYEHKGTLRFYEQHQHAQLAGKIAAAWKKDYFIGAEYWDDVMYAVKEHDRGWIDLDDSPMWEVGQRLPYGFWNYPLAIKKHFYHLGVNEVEDVNPYAALLCSLQFCKLMQMIPEDPHAIDFLKLEKKRQERLEEQLMLQSQDAKERLAFHLALLRFCDDLSIYMCIHPPGTVKSKETWFRDGLTETFDFLGGNPVIPSWDGEAIVRLTAFPFQSDLQLEVPYREVETAEVSLLGLTDAYKQAKLSKLCLTLTKA